MSSKQQQQAKGGNKKRGKAAAASDDVEVTGPPPLEIDDELHEAMCDVVVSALRFLAGEVNGVVREAIQGKETRQRAMCKKAMRSLSMPATYVVVNMLARLGDFAAEEAAARDEQRRVVLPRATTPLDVAMKEVWRKASQQVLEAHDRYADFQESGVNPYTVASKGLNRASRRVWRQCVSV